MNATVDMTNFFSWTIILHIIRALTVFNIAHVTLKNKYNTAVTFFSLMTVGLTFSFLSLKITMYFLSTLVELATMLMYYILMAVVLCFVTEGSIISKLSTSAAATITTTLSTAIFAFIADLLLDQDAQLILMYEVPLTYYLVQCLFIVSFQFIVVSLISAILKKRKSRKVQYKTRVTVLFLFPVTHIATVILITPTLLSVQSGNIINEIFNVFFIIICIVLDMLLVFAVDYIDRSEKDNIRKSNELLRAQLNMEQVEMYNEERKEFRKVKHDFSNIIATAKGFIEIGKPEKALKILSSADEHIMGLAGFSVCASETLNTVLYIKLKQAEKFGIKLQIEIDEENALLTDDYDLCRLFHNLLDNCINASSQTDAKYCKIKVGITTEKLTVETENSYKVSSSTAKKENSDEHGNGVEIIKSIVKKYNGTYTDEHANGIWKTLTVAENKAG